VWQTGRELGRLLDQKFIEKPELVDLIHKLTDKGCEVLHEFCEQGICAKCQLEQVTAEMRRVIADLLHTTDIEPHDTDMVSRRRFDLAFSGPGRRDQVTRIVK